ncbi:MAG: hypothetical protein Q8K32_07140 [Archangium sp.]|nr:hypothetical protein [Archangium sp.]
MTDEAGWFFTEPWTSTARRRGDALGLRAAADHFADIVAPDLNNATSDARWLTLLSWCLKLSHEVWQRADGGDLSRRENQRRRYAWLRPLELLWVARSLSRGGSENARQLRGRRSVSRWLDEGREARRFSMSDDQFRRYRQIGMYGAYRTLLRRLPGLTLGDGWTPSDTTLALARYVHDSLPPSASVTTAEFDSGVKWGFWRDNEDRFWVEKAWREWERVGRTTLLPTPDGDASKLPLPERSLLEPQLFPSGSARRFVAQALATARSATNHAALCDALASSPLLQKAIGVHELETLPAFIRLADSGMAAMRELWKRINGDPKDQSPLIATLAGSKVLQKALDGMREQADAWLQTPGRSRFARERDVTPLALAFRNEKTRSGQVQALVHHHSTHGGGLRWFRQKGTRIEPLLPDTGLAASDYRIRLWQLGRLAAQCGVADMKLALSAATDADGLDAEQEAA